MSGAGASIAVQRQRVRVTGTVQGVGFRPFVYREAVELGLSGFVCNDSAGVLIEVEGRPDAVARLCELLRERPPPLARVAGVDATELPPAGDLDGFRIVESSSRGSPAAPVSVDTAACADCLAEVDDPADRRFRYPFTNCTNCGPRYTIVLSVPYDRPATTMAGFVMCEACQAEYDDPADRRFHAQPNSCPVCGPRLSFRRNDGTLVADSHDALELTIERLLAGHVLAIKGLGGYHLAADATNAEAVARLRSRKARDDKPFAVMVADVEAARLLCEVDALGAAALCSAQRPIVLMPRRAPDEPVPEGTPLLAHAIAPGLPELGLMLPYTPLHHLLMDGARRPLVMTSGNLSDDPIAHLDDDAVERLGHLVDGVLSHDRAIHIRCDDSVVRSTPKRIQMLRRSRGFAPELLMMPRAARRQVLAVGAELKNTVSVAKGSTLVTSHHIGDLEHLATYQSFLQATGHLCSLYGVEPEVVVHDLHPEYLSTKFALELDLEEWAVQHHHAHVASCLAEHGRSDRVLGIAFDGLGLGTDGVLWGGEFLVADLEGFERVGHVSSVVMPGGTAAIKQPWRMALAWVATAIGPSVAARIGPRLDDRWRAVLRLIESGGPAPSTTSAGRLFDAVAALVGLRTTVTYEGQAAVELEALAAPIPEDEADTYPVELTRRDGMTVLDPAPLIAAVIDELDRGTPPALVAAGFHNGLGLGAAGLASGLAADRGLGTVALSGGVFQNSRLTRIVENELGRFGLEVLVHERVPPNDGGISVGQAAIAATASRPPQQVVS
jgi:hydrogenase maturation protein HypF